MVVPSSPHALIFSGVLALPPPPPRLPYCSLACSAPTPPHHVTASSILTCPPPLLVANSLSRLHLRRPAHTPLSLPGPPHCGHDGREVAHPRPWHCRGECRPDKGERRAWLEPLRRRGGCAFAPSTRFVPPSRLASATSATSLTCRILTTLPGWPRLLSGTCQPRLHRATVI